MGVENTNRGGVINLVEIETVNRCNGLCPFCPVNAKQPQREYAKMSEELFKKIINQFSAMNYSGCLSLFSNNEPFLDERIIDFCKYASDKLPDAMINLFTNGLLLTFDKFIAILPYLDNFVIDNYNDKKELNSPELKKIYDYVNEHPELKARVKIEFRMLNEVLSSRGGQAPNKINAFNKRAMGVLCLQPFRQMVIRPTGEVSLCCNDALGKYTLGNLNTQTTSGSFAAGTTNQGIIGGINLSISNATGVSEGDYAEFEVTGDQTYIVPGTVLGRVKGTKTWKPAYDDEINSFDEFRIAQTFQETDKSQTVLPHGYEFSVSQVFSIAVVVYGQLIESACRAINLTDNLKAKMPWYVWL